MSKKTAAAKDDFVEDIMDEVDALLPGKAFAPLKLKTALRLALRTSGHGATLSALLGALNPQALSDYRETCMDAISEIKSRKALIKE